MDISLYLGDVLIGFALLLHILEYKIREMSIIGGPKRTLSQLFHVEHRETFILVATLLIFINVLMSIDPLLSLVSALRVSLLAVFVYLFIYIYVSRGTKLLQNALYILFFSLLLQLLISFIQVISASSVGLSYLSESRLSLDIVNVAKSNIFSNTYLRGYGTFLHPNILSAYALLVAVFSLYLSRSNLFHVKHSFQLLILFISAATVSASQSKIALILIVLMITYKLNDILRLFHVEHTSKRMIIVFIFCILLLPLLNADARQSLQTRFSQLILQSEATPKEVLIGSGLGTYRLSYDKPSDEWWKYEPVHFVPIIAFKELGIVLSLGVIMYILRLTTHVPRGTILRLSPLIVFIIYILFTDHYSWDIYQGSSVLVVALVLLYIDKYRIILHNINLARQISTSSMLPSLNK
jgi:hypothetical protein